MKKQWAALAVAVLTFACAASAGAVTFLPVLSAPGLEEATTAPRRLRVAVLATFWSLPDVEIPTATGFRAGDKVAFEPRVAPLAAAEYRLSPRWGIGGWYNPLSVDYRLKTTTGVSQVLTRGQMNMWDVHVSRRVRGDATLQLGVVRYRGTVSFRVQNPYGAGNLPPYPADPAKVGMGGTDIHAWGYKSYPTWGYKARPAYLTAGLGVRQRISDESPSSGPDFAGQISLAYSWFPSERISTEAALWLADVTNGNALSVRFHAGVTGHF